MEQRVSELENGGEHGERGTGIGYRAYGTNDGSRVWMGTVKDREQRR